MNKYKVGDKVVVKSLDQILSETDGRTGLGYRSGSRFHKTIKHSNSFVGSMQPYCGKILTIKSHRIDKDVAHYKVLENSWGWCDWMFQDSHSDIPTDFTIDTLEV